MLLPLLSHKCEEHTLLCKRPLLELLWWPGLILVLPQGRWSLLKADDPHWTSDSFRVQNVAANLRRALCPSGMLLHPALWPCLFFLQLYFWQSFSHALLYYPSRVGVTLSSGVVNCTVSNLLAIGCLGFLIAGKEQHALQLLLAALPSLSVVERHEQPSSDQHQTRCKLSAAREAPALPGLQSHSIVKSVKCQILL